MDEMLKKLLASEVLSEETKSVLEEGFKKLVEEAKQVAEQKVRAELAERYEKDKESMAIALEQYLDQGLDREIKEFREGLAQIDALKSKYASAISGVKKAAKNHVISRLEAMESKMDEVLAQEIGELHEDMKVNRKAYLNAINESKTKLKTMEAKFKSKAAAVLENIIDVRLEKEIAELREDIKAAKTTHFEGQIFEAFSSVFRRQFFNTNKEFKNLVSKLTETEQKLSKVKTTANAKINEANNRIRQVVSQKTKLEESVKRTQTMSKLLSNLTGTSRSKMKSLLEATSTNELDRTYKKFINEVLNEATAPKQSRKIDEAVVELRTGTSKLNESNEVIDDDIVQLMRRAGVPARK